MKRTTTVFTALLALLFLFGATGCFEKPSAGEIGVLRSAGPLDDTGIMDVLCPGTGTRTVWNNKVHYYPHGGVQRYYTITADPERSDSKNVDVVKVQSADGKLVGLEGTIYFNTAFDCSDEGRKLVEDFDSQFGVRKFPFGNNEYYPHSGDSGWAAFLDTIVRPIIDNELRQALLKFDCAELISSCALVASQGRIGTGTEASERTNINLQNVQDEVNSGLKREINGTLGQEYLTNIQFRLARVTLEPELQEAINKAQAAFAQVAQAEAQVQTASRQRAAAQKLVRVYQRAPVLGQLEMLRILCGVTQARVGQQTQTGGCRDAQVFLGVNPTGLNVTPR